MRALTIVLLLSACSAPQVVTEAPAPPLAPSPSVVSVNAPASATLFAETSVTIPLTLTFSGAPAPVAVATVSAPTGITASYVNDALTIAAAADAVSGPLTLSVSAPGTSAAVVVSLTIVSASIVTPPAGTLLVGAPVSVDLRITGGTPAFAGALSASELSGGLWRVTYAAPSSGSLSISVQLAGVSRSLTTPVQVSTTVNARFVSSAGLYVANEVLWLNDAQQATTNSVGVATFTNVTAPYRVTYRPTANAAYVFADLTSVAPVIPGAPWAAKKSASVDFVFGANTIAHQSANVVVDVAGVQQSSATRLLGPAGTTGRINVDWWTPEVNREAIIRVSFRDAAGNLVATGRELLFLQEGQALSVHVAITATVTTPREFTFVPPPGFTLLSKQVSGVLGDDPLELHPAGGNQTSATTIAYQAPTNIGADISLYAVATHGNGGSVVGIFSHVQAASATGVIKAPPDYDLPLTSNVIPGWQGAFPMYTLNLSRNGTYVYVHTNKQQLDFPLPVSFPAGDVKMQVCGTDRYASVDDYTARYQLMDLDVSDVTKSYSRSCGRELLLPLTP